MARTEPISPRVAWAESIKSASSAQLQIERSRELIRQSKALLKRPVHRPMWAGPPQQRRSPDAAKPPADLSQG